MTKAELITSIAGLPDNAAIFVDVKPWDEALNLTPPLAVQCYPGRGDDLPFATITPDTDGATRLDPSNV